MTSLRNALLGVRALWHFDNRWQLIINRTLFPWDSLLVYKKGDLEFLVDHAAGDHNGTRLCLISDIYTRFLPLMDLGDTISVFDLGANGGGFPLMLQLHGKKFSRLLCVEMNPNTFNRLRYNVTRNIRGDTRLENAAVCGSRRQLSLDFGRGDISDSIYQEAIDKKEQFSIAGRTFDDLFHSHFGDQIVDLCKMDIEGAEYEVLSSAEQTRLGLCRYLVIEVHAAPIEKQEDLGSALANLSFKHVEIGGDSGCGERLYRNERLS